MIKQKIYIGADHAGFELKEQVKQYFTEHQVDFEDLGNKEHEKNDDYPDFALAVAERVVADNALGILFCHNGVGMCIAANKLKGVRAVNTNSSVVAKEARNDDHVNILCLSGGYLSLDEAVEIINTWLNTDYSTDERYQRRVDKINQIENK